MGLEEPPKQLDGVSDEKTAPEALAGNEPPSAGDGEGSDDGTGPDPESLDRVPSGPPLQRLFASTKRWIITMATFAGFLSPMTANIYFPALNPIATDLGVSISRVNLTLTSMIFQAISLTMVDDFGDMAGRRRAFILSMVIYMFANLGLALQDDYAALLVLRTMQSLGNNGTLALFFAVVADVAVSAERGKYMGIIGAGINTGPALSPVLGGILAQYLGWRSIFWFCLIYTGAWIIPFAIAVPETSRNVVGNGSVPARGWNLTLVDYIRSRRQLMVRNYSANKLQPKLRIPNPLNALKALMEKDLAMLYFYGTLVYLNFILICATLSTQFVRIYGYNDLQIGLCYLPYGVGCCFAAVVQGRILDWSYRRIARKIGFTIDYRRGDDLRTFPIEEARIQPVGLRHRVVFLLNTLGVDLYPEAPATAVATNNLLRCLFGAGGTALIETMLEAMGRGWTFTFWAVVLVAFSPILWILTKWGPGWREERRVGKLNAKMGNEKEGESRPR
ncbi:major facilitator superfamily domain-containing protein [Apodospora peruviana]|uniref:Major facilitator superfamily domain-containing protein n=1 Tax=Apodospora peruviana TaxID=516989 RepID=A0AAE0M4Y5_9PEZI|nr:major facilitator superfamily domain-containing protein [Apodospora peruviana]